MPRIISRRTTLRGLGAAMTLPWLEAMGPLSAWAVTAPGAKTAAAPNRLAFLYVPNGVDIENWTPKTEGSDYELPACLEPLAEHRQDFCILTGLTADKARSHGDGGGDHARALAAYLTGVQPRKTSGTNIRGGKSVDQAAAGRIGDQTRLPSLEIGCERGGMAGNCDSGYSCVYSSTMAWRSATTPLPKEVNPRLVFERLFGESSEDPATMARRATYRRSILDFVMNDAKTMKVSLGPTDNRKLDEYLDGIREIERRIEQAEKEGNQIAPSMEHPDGVPVEFADHVKLMFDLMAVAFQTDSTRVATFMIGREGSTRTYREIGIPDAHHPLTHHRNDPELIEKVTRINCFHMQQYAYFLQKLGSIHEGDGTLLDNVMIVYGSGLSDGNQHDHANLPVLVAGGGAGSLKTGRHVQYKKDTPMANLLVSMLDRMGVQHGLPGDATGPLDRLSDLV